LRSSPLAPSGLSVFVIVSRCGSDGQLLQPSSQPFELLVCAEIVQAVNADLNCLSVVVGDTVDVFGAAHDRLQSRECSVIGAGRTPSRSQGVEGSVVAPRHV